MYCRECSELYSTELDSTTVLIISITDILANSRTFFLTCSSNRGSSSSSCGQRAGTAGLENEGFHSVEWPYPHCPSFLDSALNGRSSACAHALCWWN